MNASTPERESMATEREPQCHQDQSAVNGAREEFGNCVRVVAGTVPEGMSFDKWLQRMRISNSHYFEQGGEVLVPTSFKTLPCNCCREDPNITEWSLKRNPSEMNIVHTACNKPIGQVGAADILV